jgi:hypothetical protein
MVNYALTESNSWYDINGGGGNGAIGFGTIAGFDLQGATRFTSLNYVKDTTVQTATLYFYIGNKGSGSGNVQGIVYGIDEDNTSDFSGGSPMARNATDAHTDIVVTIPSVGNYISVDVTSIVNEILSRAGWSSGNALAFKFYNQGSPADVWWSDSPLDTYLIISIPSASNSPSVSPSASKSPSGSASPSPERQGRNVIRVALPGYDALTDTNPDHFALYSDEDWVLIKEFRRDSVEIAHGDTEIITHNLGYIPFFAVYANGEWVTGFNIYSDYRAYATTTTLTLVNNNASTQTFMYYIFYDNMA